MESRCDDVAVVHDALRSIAGVALLVDFAREQGIDVGRCLRDSGIDASLLADLDAEIRTGQELRVVRNVLDILGDRQGLGLRVGLRYHVAKQGAFGYALLTSATVRQAIEVFMRYAELSFIMASISYETASGEYRVTIDDSALPLDLRGFLLERDVAAVLASWADLFDTPIPIQRVEVAAPLADRVRDTLAMNVEMVETSGPHRLILDERRLDLPMPAPSPHTAALLADHCELLLRRREQAAGTAGLVRRILLRHRTIGTTQHTVADLLGISARTLHRRLAEEGVSFRDIAAEIFGELATELLATGLPVERVAERLGYADASSFAHAFKRWSGQSPGRFAQR